MNAVRRGRPWPDLHKMTDVLVGACTVEFGRRIFWESKRQHRQRREYEQRRNTPMQEASTFLLVGSRHRDYSVPDSSCLGSSITFNEKISETGQGLREQFAMFFPSLVK